MKTSTTTFAPTTASCPRWATASAPRGRRLYLSPGRGLPDDGFLSRLRVFQWNERQETQKGDVLSRQSVVGAGMDGKLNSFLQIRYHHGDLEAGGRALPDRRVNVIVDLKPSQTFSQLYFTGWVGEFPDFANAREGDGGSVR